MDNNNTIDELIKASQILIDLEEISSEELQPREDTLENIFNYSRSLKIYKTEQLEQVEVNLN